MKPTLAQLVEKRREKYREQSRINNEYFAYSAQRYVALVKVDFAVVLECQHYESDSFALHEGV